MKGAGREGLRQGARMLGEEGQVDASNFVNA